MRKKAFFNFSSKSFQIKNVSGLEPELPAILLNSHTDVVNYNGFDFNYLYTLKLVFRIIQTIFLGDPGFKHFELLLIRNKSLTVKQTAFKCWKYSITFKR